MTPSVSARTPPGGAGPLAEPEEGEAAVEARPSDVVGPAGATIDDEATDSGSDHRRDRTGWRTWALRLGLGVLVLVAVGTRVEADRRHDDARTAEAVARAAEAEQRLVEQRVAAAGADASLAERAAAVRASQVADARARLAEAGFEEATLDAVLAAEGQSAADIERYRDATADLVARQAAALPELKGCLTAAERAAAVAFNAANDPDVVVPAPSDTCTSLAREGP